MDYQKEDIFLHIESDVEFNIRVHSCAKEPETVDWIHTVFQEGDVFYDIGANVGAYSLVASKFLGGKVRVFAFEPGFVTFKELYGNIVLNNCQDSIVALQIALSDHTAVDVLHYNNLIPGGALHALGDAIDYKGDAFQPILKQAVLAFSLDDLIKHFGLPIPNHIKIDVDGIEWKILQGARETLSNPLVKSVLLEIEEGGGQSVQIIEFLQAKGLKLHSKHQYVYEGPTSSFAGIYNCIFRR